MLASAAQLQAVRAADCNLRSPGSMHEIVAVVMNRTPLVIARQDLTGLDRNAGTGKEGNTNKPSKTGFFASGADVEGKHLQEDLITQEAASKSVHVLGQGLLAT